LRKDSAALLGTPIFRKVKEMRDCQNPECENPPPRVCDCEKLWVDRLIVVIDDERTFNTDDNIVYLRTENEALAFLARTYCEASLRYGPAIELYLDHDLGENQDIRIVVDFLVCLGGVPWVSDVWVHSQNPTTEWIVQVLRKAGYKAHRIPLPTLV